MSTFPASDILVGLIFWVFLALAAGGALLAALSRWVIRSVCGLALCCLGLAGLYYYLHSPFLALMEILIYIGAVCVTIIFAVMLAEPEETVPTEEKRVGGLFWVGGGLLVSVSLFGTLAWLGTQPSWTAPAERLTDGSVRAIGISLLTTYSLAFELISLVLMVAILGALAVARMGRKRV